MMQITIVQLGRGIIKLMVDGRLLTIYGEAMLPRTLGESAEFVVYLRQVKYYDSPFGQTKVDVCTLKNIKSFLDDEFAKRKLIPIYE